MEAGVRIQIFSLVAILLLGCGKDPTPQERYPGPWGRDLGLPVTRALVRNHVENCGLAVMKPAFGKNSKSGDYLVYCTRNDHQLDERDHWDAYIVLPARNQVTRAPSEVVLAIPPPPREFFGYEPLKPKDRPPT